MSSVHDKSFGFIKMPKGAFTIDLTITIKRAAPISNGTLSNILLNIKTIEQSRNVSEKILIAPRSGVQMKNLLYSEEER